MLCISKLSIKAKHQTGKLEVVYDNMVNNNFTNLNKLSMHIINNCTWNNVC